MAPSSTRASLIHCVSRRYTRRPPVGAAFGGRLPQSRDELASARISDAWSEEPGSTRTRVIDVHTTLSFMPLSGAISSEYLGRYDDGDCHTMHREPAAAAAESAGGRRGQGEERGDRERWRRVVEKSVKYNNNTSTPYEVDNWQAWVEIQYNDKDARLETSELQRRVLSSRCYNSRNGATAAWRRRGDLTHRRTNQLHMCTDKNGCVPYGSDADGLWRKAGKEKSSDSTMGFPTMLLDRMTDVERLQS